MSQVFGIRDNLSLPLLPSPQTGETSNPCLPCFISTTNQREISEFKISFSPYNTDKQTQPLREVPAYLSPSTYGASYSGSLRLPACKQEVPLRGGKGVCQVISALQQTLSTAFCSHTLKVCQSESTHRNQPPLAARGIKTGIFYSAGRENLTRPRRKTILTPLI